MSPEWRGKGVGKTMMDQAHNWFKEKGVNIIRVETAASNKRSLMFYKKFGYEPNYILLQKGLSKKEGRF